MSAKLSFFFGAGAEVGYGMPAGGRFALDIFRRSMDDERAQFQRMRAGINPRTVYATDWLPPGYETKRVAVFGSPDRASLFEASLEYRRTLVRDGLNRYDELCREVLRRAGVDERELSDLFEQVFGRPIGAETYAQEIELNPSLGANGSELFRSAYFSAGLDVLGKHPQAVGLRNLLRGTLELYVGSLGQQLVSSLNDQIFQKAPNIPIFDDLAGIFRLEYGQAGLAAYRLVLEETRAPVSLSEAVEVAFESLAFHVIETIMAQCLDYQGLVDGNFRYLYAPREWAKFCKISTFLLSVRSYIAELEAKALSGLDGATGYYHDILASLAQGRIRDVQIGTANYTAIFDRVMEDGGSGDVRARFLNGSVRDFYDPYRNMIVAQDGAALDRAGRFLVPFMFTQSGIKPLTSVEMSRRYVDYYDAMCASDAVVVLGYGFNGDDGHINGMFRAVTEEAGKPLFVCLYAPGGPAGVDLAREGRDLARKIRLDRPERLTVLPVGNDRRAASGEVWVDEIAARMATTP